MEVKPPGRFVRSGKVKDIYEVDGGHLLFHFTDRVSAYDVVLPTTIPRKGEVLCKLGAYLFESLGVPHHMVRLEGEDMMVVKRMSMIPVECVVRGYLYGSLMERMEKGEVALPVEKLMATKLPEPYFDPTTKSDLKDEPITEGEIVSQGRATAGELAQIRQSSLGIYGLLSEKAARAGFILADIKLEFGRHNGEVLLGDSVGPDEFRMWPASKYSPGKTQESYDKQPIRDWLSSEGYKGKLDLARKSGAPVPPPPTLPDWLCEETARRYAAVYEALSGKRL
ncbi:MAG TPA: phosphoribosylaminoimidazolesuccinocarboxamide synthase [Nitrososphaerales archaeon]|nr:phosphoribosylaminoimidazolesuccinocarboxamide synthase [Nitrososphaerales archaeon]